jgi:hypothetical protein
MNDKAKPQYALRESSLYTLDDDGEHFSLEFIRAQHVEACVLSGVPGLCWVITRSADSLGSRFRFCDRCSGRAQ